MNSGHASHGFLYKKPPPLWMSNQILRQPVASFPTLSSCTLAQIDMQKNISESPESSAPLPNILFTLDFPPIVPFEEFSAEVDRLLLHPQGDRLSSHFTQMLGITIRELAVDTHDQYTEDANGSGRMATSSSTAVVHEGGQTNDPVAGDSSPQG